MVTSGEHLRAIRKWIQHNAMNGDTIMWGSSEPLKLPRLTPRDLEELAQEIREAVLKEFKIKDHTHKYNLRLVCMDEGPMIQEVDDWQELWIALFRVGGKVRVEEVRGDRNYAGQHILVFEGTVEEAMKWCRECSHKSDLLCMAAP